MNANPQVISYGSASKAFIGGLQGNVKRCLNPRLGDLVTHIMWSGAFGILLSRSSESVVVLWTIPPGQKRTREDVALDERTEEGEARCADQE